MLKGTLYVVLACVGALMLAGCGADGDDPDHADVPVPGYGDPCDSPMAGVLGCPADNKGGPQLPTTPETPEAACARLVSCGVLADTHERLWSKEWHHYLDYRWCVARLRNPVDRRCSVDGHYSLQEVQRAVRCMLETPCGALGAPFSEKVKSSSRRPKLDKFFCADGTTEVWTATICDHGLLYY